MTGLEIITADEVHYKIVWLASSPRLDPIYAVDMPCSDDHDVRVCVGGLQECLDYIHGINEPKEET